MIFCMQKGIPFLTSFLDIVKILQTGYFDYFENAGSCLSIMIGPPLRDFNVQSVEIENFGDQHAKNQLHL